MDRVENHAKEMSLDYVSTQYLVWLYEKNLPPEIFRPKDLSHAPSQAYLREKELVGHVPRLQGPALVAFRWLQRPRVRQALEVLATTHNEPQDILRALNELGVRGASHEVVQVYLHLFWAVADMDSTTLRAVIALRTPVVENVTASAAVEQALIEAGTPTTAPPLPSPHNVLQPTFSDHSRARSRRADGNPTLLRDLERTLTPDQRLQQAQALKRASYGDPLQLLTRLPKSPLTLALGRAQLGLPLARLDMKKAYDVLLVMGTHKLAEHLASDHPDASRRAVDYANTTRILLQIQREFGASQTSLRDQLQTIEVLSRTAGHYGAPEAAMPGTFRASPYLTTDLENAREMVLKQQPKLKAPVEEDDEMAEESP